MQDTYRFINIKNKYDDGTNGEGQYRSEFQRDYARVLTSPSFRRLQNKTQLFPGQESDFFRNRLTHSLEVAQIAKSIAHKFKLNYKADFIEEDVCEIAGLIHDLGHPPFGHNGEKALDHCMRTAGGFEGNAQTIHIITRLEKKERLEHSNNYKPFSENGEDMRRGLNLTARSIASALKYDSEIHQLRGNDEELKKGYYSSDKSLVDEIKQKLVDKDYSGKFKTIECSIMDIADDIAYSTYDIEDAFKAGFLTPYGIMSASDNIYLQISKKLKRDNISADVAECKLVICNLFSDIFSEVMDIQKEICADDPEFSNKTKRNFLDSYARSKKLANDGYERTKFSSFLVSRFINGLSLDLNHENKILSTVKIEEKVKKEINILKHFSYVCLINSSRLKVVETRGYEIIKKMFEKLSDEKGYFLLPEDFQELYNATTRDSHRKRIICDFIAGMTDTYALEFYGRLFSENPQTIFKPL